MWSTKTFATREAFNAWVEENDSSHQWQEIFVNNGYGVEFKPLKRIEFHDEEEAECPNCGGPLVQMGRLGRRVHSRCRNCGLDSSREA